MSVFGYTEPNKFVLTQCLCVCIISASSIEPISTKFTPKMYFGIPYGYMISYFDKV